jgi:DNA-binding CsgD family transcriptional regulator
MSGSVPVFVQADEPAVQAALVDVLLRQGGIAVVDHADGASWIVLMGSEIRDGDRPVAERVVAFVTSVEAPRSCHVVVPVLAALAAGQPPAPDGRSALPGTAVTRLGSALVQATGRPSELTAREQAVLRLIARGRTTAEVAAELSYSERSIKNVIHGVTERLALRNRCHVVAHAVREGWI